MKCDVKIDYFHDEYVKKFDKLDNGLALSKLLYSRVLKLFFKFIKEKLYAGFEFTTPIGIFKIVKIDLNPNIKRISFAGSYKEGKTVYRNPKNNFFHRLVWVPTDLLTLRYTFKASQKFSDNIFHHASNFV